MIYKAGEILYGIKIYFAVSLYKLYSIPKSKSKRQTICIWKTITVTGGLMDKLYTDFSKTTGTIKRCMRSTTDLIRIRVMTV